MQDAAALTDSRSRRRQPPRYLGPPYDDTVTLHVNGEDVQLIPIRAAHTDGDTLVRFLKHDLLAVGDYYRSVGYPFTDHTEPSISQDTQTAEQFVRWMYAELKKTQWHERDRADAPWQRNHTPLTHADSL
jgi:hypothetical protein